MTERLYIVVSFDRTESGDLVPCASLRVESGEVAERRAFEAAVRHAGALAFSTRGTSNAGELDAAVESAAYGDIIGCSQLRWSRDRASLEGWAPFLDLSSPSAGSSFDDDCRSCASPK